MSRAGAHAGRLHTSEQFVFAMVFALMAGFVVVITMSAVRSPMNSLFAGGAAAAGSQTIPAGTGGSEHRSGSSSARGPAIQAASPRLDTQLAAAIDGVLAGHPGRVAVGVIDETTGQQARYGSIQRIRSGGVTTADILAALLLREQHAGAALTTEQQALASAMGNGSASAATALWRDIGAGNGLASANRLLDLTQTIPGPRDHWDQTSTTVADQLQLLIDLTSSRSPLTAANRDYALRVIGDHGTGPRWGVSVAGHGNAALSSWQPAGALSVASSAGVVQRGGHVLLIVVLSSGSPSQAAAASLASAAAVAAADVITGARH